LGVTPDGARMRRAHARYAQRLQRVIRSLSW
jgi:hypothetical protein